MEAGGHKHDESCKQVFELLSQYLDAELPAASCAEIEQHLADCEPCIEFLDSLRRSIALCKDCGCAEVPRPMTSDAKEQLQAAFQKMIASKTR